MLKHLRLAAVAASAILCLHSAVQAGCIVPPNADAMQKELLAHLNAERKAYGLSALTLSGKLDKAAQGVGLGFELGGLLLGVLKMLCLVVGDRREGLDRRLGRLQFCADPSVRCDELQRLGLALPLGVSSFSVQ